MTNSLRPSIAVAGHLRALVIRATSWILWLLAVSSADVVGDTETALALLLAQPDHITQGRVPYCGDVAAFIAEEPRLCRESAFGLHLGSQICDMFRSMLAAQPFCDGDALWQRRMEEGSG